MKNIFVEQQSLAEYAEKAYLNYSMYVVLDRALPHIGDGLKPVQRRIIYAMSELGLRSGTKFKKSARTVGDVIGKFHPHGDTAVYEAMIIMAQSFSYRHPLIDGQGNWGSSDDPKSFAAMRYTESRLTPYANSLLAELNMGNTDWLENFDGTLTEPVVLPAQVPNLLLNGGTGIAVGMSTDIPPHNLNEVCTALCALIDKPNLPVEQVLAIIKAPDFATAAPIVNTQQEIRDTYLTGKGSIKQQAKWHREQNLIVITALPMHTSGAKVLDQIGNQMLQKKLPMLVDLIDESDTEIRLVLELKSKKVDVQQLIAHLFATTDLERNHRVNLNVIGINGLPARKPMLTILTEWLQWRSAIVKQRINYRLGKIDARLHLLDGLLIALLNIDAVIAIIRTEDKPLEKLMQRFNLSKLQANYILDTRLRQLARIEEVQLQAEKAKLEAEKAGLQQLLDSPSKFKKQLKAEIKLAMQAVWTAAKVANRKCHSSI